MMKKGRWLVLFLLMVLLSFGAMTGKVSAASESKIGETSATIMKKQKLEITGVNGKWLSTSRRTVNVTLKEGKTTKIKLYGTKIRSVSTNKKSVAVIKKNGKITAKKAGKAKLTIRGKNGKKYICNVTVTPQITGVTLNKTSLELLIGKKASLTATVKPAKATNKKVKFISSNPAVAKVNNSGVVTAVGEGTANITVTAAGDSKKKAVCKVKVRSTVVTTQNELDALDALIEMGAEEITLQSDTSAEFVVPRIDCPNVNLVVDVPNADVTNKGNCNQIVVKSVNNNFVEQAMGNDIIYQDNRGKITIGSEARDTNVYIAGENSSVEIENNGFIGGLWLQKFSELKIRGTSSQRVPTTAQPESAGSTITTCKNLQLSAEAKINLILEEGAEHTLATVTDDANIPTVRGLGSVEVTNTVTHEVETVVAENDDSVISQRNITMGGGVESYEGTALEGAEVSLIKYRSSINTDNILNYAEGAVHSTADASGRYSFANVSLGNYYLTATMANMQTVVQTVIINSDTGSNYNNEMIQMIPVDMMGTGSVSGTVIDAGTGQPVTYPVTLKIRKGKTNRSGMALQTVNVPNNGQYRFDNLPAGAYTVQVISGEGGLTSITTNYSNTLVLAGTDTICNITVTPMLSRGELRFVLRWGTKESGAPSDLDSHLVGPTEDGSRFHTWFPNEKKRYYYNGQLFDELDVDDTSWEGPETSTIRHMVSGVYDFFVFDYGNQENESSSEMSQRSNAYVQVYDGDVLLATYHIPQGKTGNLWHVCSFDSNTGRLMEVGTVGYWPADEGEYIGGNLLDVVRDSLLQKINRLRTLCDENLSDGAYKTEVSEALAQAQTLYDSSQNYEELAAMNGKLLIYINAIQNMPEQELLDAINQASTVQLNETASFETSDSKPVCYTFTPAEAGYYTFRIIPETEGAEAYCRVYNQQYGIEISGSHAYGENATVLSMYLKAGEKYVFAITENALSTGNYTAILKQGRYVTKSSFYNEIDSVESYYEDRYIEDSALKTEIGDILNKANEAYENYSEENMEEIIPLYEKLQEYESLLEDLPKQSVINGINGATALQFNVPENITISKTVYYSFTAEEKGYYVLTIIPNTEDAEPYCVVYDSDYKSRYSAGYNGTQTAVYINMDAGQKYFFAISEDSLDTASYTVTVKNADSAEGTPAMFELEIDLDVLDKEKAETEEMTMAEDFSESEAETDLMQEEAADTVIDEQIIETQDMEVDEEIQTQEETISEIITGGEVSSVIGTETSISADSLGGTGMDMADPAAEYLGQ